MRGSHRILTSTATMGAPVDSSSDTLTVKDNRTGKVYTIP